MDIIIFSGQSNMMGQTECLSDRGVIANAFEYKFLSDNIVPLKDPVGENITNDGKEGGYFGDGIVALEWLDTHALGAACYGNTNLVPSFCKGYTDETKDTVLAVHAAKGSTTIAEWMPGMPCYDMMIKKASASIKKAEETDTTRHIFFVWLQGESDAIMGNDKAYYKGMLSSLADSLKKDLQIEKFCMIRVGRFTNDERDCEIISAQDEICADDPDFLMLTDIATEMNTVPEYMNPNVAGHFSAKGLEYLGGIAGRALGAWCKNTER